MSTAASVVPGLRPGRYIFRCRHLIGIDGRRDVNGAIQIANAALRA